MTRTARAAYPRAVNKDRSEPRTGLHDTERKDGGGQHNWGKLSDEEELENAALKDLAQEEEESGSEEEAAGGPPAAHRRPSKCRPSRRKMAQQVKLPLSEEELEQARQFRKQAGKNLRADKTDDLDLTSIARTSAAVLPREEGSVVQPIVPGYKPEADGFPTYSDIIPSRAIVD